MKYFLKVFRTSFIILALILLTQAGCGGESGLIFTLTVQVEGSGTVTSNPAGINCVPDCSDDFITGTQVELTAVPAPGFEFTGWSGGGCSGIDTCTVTMNSDVQVTATFSIFQIVFTSRADANGDDSGISNLWKINLDGTGLQALTQTTTVGTDSFSPRWSPDNSKIVFASLRNINGSDTPNANDTENIWVMNADGSAQMPLTQLEADGANCRDPQWSPDGSKILFVSSRALNGSDASNSPNDTQNIWVMNADGSNPLPLTNLTAQGAGSFRPQWSPDGSQIVYESTRDLDPNMDAPNLNFTRNIWVMDSNGSNATALTDLTADNAGSFNPQWSPDGMQIVFQSRRDLNPANDAANTNLTDNIWRIDADGSNPIPLTLITADMGSNLVPQWSKDGSQIAYQSRRALNGTDAASTSFNIWIMDADGQNALPLTQLDTLNFGAFEPVFSSDDSKIVFDSEGALDGSNAPGVNGTANIFVINPDGTDNTSLTKNTESKADSFEPQVTR